MSGLVGFDPAGDGSALAAASLGKPEKSRFFAKTDTPGIAGA